VCKPGLCIRCRRGTHIIPALVGGSKVVAMHWGCGPRSLLRDWFREDLLRGQNLNMVLTIITISSSYTKLLLIRSQINNYKSLGRQLQKRAVDSIYELFKLGCFSMNTVQNQQCFNLYTVVFMNRAGLFTLWLVNGQAFSRLLPRNFSTINTLQRSMTILKISFNNSIN
jgi:hypothetical protein